MKFYLPKIENKKLTLVGTKEKKKTEIIAEHTHDQSISINRHLFK